MHFARIAAAATMSGYLLLAMTARADAPAKAPPPEDSFLEFLGQDDVEDAKWWEFFKRSAQRDRDGREDAAPNEGQKHD